MPVLKGIGVITLVTGVAIAVVGGNVADGDDDRVVAPIGESTTVTRKLNLESLGGHYSFLKFRGRVTVDQKICRSTSVRPSSGRPWGDVVEVEDGVTDGRKAIEIQYDVAVDRTPSLVDKVGVLSVEATVLYPFESIDGFIESTRHVSYEIPIHFVEDAGFRDWWKIAAGGCVIVGLLLLIASRFAPTPAPPMPELE